MITPASLAERTYPARASVGRAVAAARMLLMPQWLTWSGTLPVARDHGRSASWRVLGQRRFTAYFAGSFISNMGTWLQNTAQILLTYQLTHSAFAVGAVTCLQFSGFLVLGPWAATLADRMGAKRVLIGSQVVSAGIAAAMAALQFDRLLTEMPLMIGALGIGLAFTFALPVQTAMVPGLVREADTRAALAMNSVSYNAGRTLAPILCVAVFASIGAGWAFALNAVSFLVFATVLLVIHPGDGARLTRRPHDWSGLRIALWRPRILLLLAMVAAVTMTDDPIQVLGPALAHQVLHVSGAWPAYFLSALGLGTVLAALVPTKPAHAHGVAGSLLLLGASAVVFVAGISPWISLLAAATAGVAGLLTGSAAQALLFKSARLGQEAQVMALWAIAWAGSKPLASLADGWLASHLDLLRAGLLLATPGLIVAVLEICMPKPWKQRVKHFARTHLATPAMTR
jgi:MFS family permease